MRIWAAVGQRLFMKRFPQFPLSLGGGLNREPFMEKIKQQRVLSLVRCVGLLLFSALWLRSAWVSDDAFITFRSVEFTWNGFGPRWNLAERVQAYSHPLWFGLLVGVRSLTSDLFLGTLTLSLLFSLATVALLLWRLKTPTSVVAVVVLVCSSKSFIEFSSSGLENPLCHLLVLLIFLLALGSGPTAPRWRGLALGALLSMVALCRIDLLVLIGPLIGFMLWRERSKAAVFGFILGLTPLVTWEAWSLFYYGDLVPNTACAKVNHVLPLSVRWVHAADYFRSSLVLDYLTIPVVLVSCLAGLWRGGARRHISAGVLLYFLYLGWIPGDFMAGRMQSTPFLVAVALIPNLPPFRTYWAVVLVGLVLLVSLANPRSPLRLNRLVSVDDVGDLADERAHYCCDRSQKDLRPEPWNGLPPKVLVGWGGGITYETGPSAHFVDLLALSDPLLARLPVITRPGGRFRPGHLSRVIPDGYLESLRTGENEIQDPAVAALWDDVRVATRGSLTDLRRLRAIGGTVLCGRAHRDAVMARNVSDQP